MLTSTKQIQAILQFTMMQLSSMFIVAWLFYLDEGFHNFNWMKQPGAWIVFFIYTLVFLGPQLLVRKLLMKRNKAWESSIVSCVLVSLSLTVLMIMLFSKW